MTSRSAAFLLICFVLAFGSGAQKDCDSGKKRGEANDSNNMTNTNQPRAGSDLPEVIARGSYGQMEQPFVYVVRSDETYEHLRGLLTELPPASSVDFGLKAAVAAFAGVRPTGGFSVEIEEAARGVAVSVKAPPPDAFVTEALTMPYAVALVRADKDASLNIELTDNWLRAGKEFEVKSGSFEYSGGITGKKRKFDVSGKLTLWQFGDLATIRFDLSGTGDAGDLKLSDTASGVIRNDRVEFARLDAGSFSERPRPALKVTGTLKEGKFTLEFSPHPPVAADGFSAAGRIEAVARR